MCRFRGQRLHKCGCLLLPNVIVRVNVLATSNAHVNIRVQHCAQHRPYSDPPRDRDSPLLTSRSLYSRAAIQDMLESTMYSVRPIILNISVEYIRSR